MRFTWYWFVLDLLVLLLLLLLIGQPPRQASGLVVRRHCEHLGSYPGCPVQRYRYGVTVRTDSGEHVRLRVSRDQLGVLEVYDLVSGVVCE
jgi:hypothetical protein